MRQLILPRRRLLRCAALAAPAIIGRAGAKGFGRGGSLNGANAPAPPSDATSFGFTHLTFWDDFDSLATIDVNNTLAPGFNWYLTNAMIRFSPPFGTQANGLAQNSGSIALANSILTFTPSQACGGWLCSPGYTGLSGTRAVGGFLADTGGYFEAKMKFDNTQRQSANNLTPAFWMWDYRFNLKQVDIDTTTGHWAELDFMEYFGGGLNNGPGGLGFNVHDWTDNLTNVDGSGFSGTAIPSNTDMSLWHTYGCLWVPQAKNGGTGIINYYFDGVHYPHYDIQYSASTQSPQAHNPGAFVGVFTCLEDCPGYQLQLGTGSGWPLQIDYVVAWQP